ncbi:hypothetical protein RD110_07890 [Rhodoferax koreense]|uniref:Uncharacterized protein n=1 Tax=Rhodoferax koreensis TaxID=1842727 RepID=A0A1P8JTN7_9BURK|nr:hypothetical protein [Rhodoferax koreense]APW37124.1 hypothetical protein RD110_07890 [Rhodoferax koreense]
MANPTAGTPTRATRAKTAPPPSVVEDPTTSALSPAQTVWIESARPILREWIDNLYELNNTIISEEAEGPAAKLVDLAEREIKRLQRAEDTDDGWRAPYEFSYELSYGMQVLFEAAHSAADETVCDPAGLVRHAALVAQAAAWTHLVSETVDKLPASIDTLREVCKGSAVSFAASRTPSPAKPISANSMNGYNPAQVKMAFEHLASMACTIRDYLEQDEAVSPFPAIMMVSQVGALADQMANFSVIGPVSEWAIGPQFRDAGKAVTA